MTATYQDFRSTCWSLVQASPQGASGDVRTRFNQLCLRYWAPVSWYLRRDGYAPDQADRITHAFFDHLQRSGLDQASRYARFRVFLLDELQHFLADDAAVGAAAPLPTPEVHATPMPAAEAATPEQAMHRGFALEVIGHAMTRLREETERNGHAEMFEQLQSYLASVPANDDYSREAAALGARPVFVAIAVQRLRQRFRELVDDELAQVVSDAGEFAGEREALLQALERER